MKFIPKSLLGKKESRNKNIIDGEKQKSLLQKKEETSDFATAHVVNKGSTSNGDGYSLRLRTSDQI